MNPLTLHLIQPSYPLSAQSPNSVHALKATHHRSATTSAQAGLHRSSVMGPEGSPVHSSTFTDKVPPSFDGHSEYSVYRQGVELWTFLTTLDNKKHGPALIGRLSGEAKAAAKTIPIAEITSEGGVTTILQRLDKSYAINKTDQLDADLAIFLDFTWNGRSPVEQFIAGFHNRLDRIAELNMSSKLKGHILLRQASLEHQARSLIVGAASGSYEVEHISAALRQAYRHTPVTANMNTQPSPHSQNKMQGEQGRGRDRTKTRHSPSYSNRDTFYTFATSVGKSKQQAIIDSGACASVVGKDTLDIVMKSFGMSSVENTTPSIHAHRFGNHQEEQKTLFAIRFPLTCQCSNKKEIAKFHIKFDVIPGELPFLIGYPSLKAMKANLNFKFNEIGFHLRDKHVRIKLETDENHIYLPFGQSCASSSRFSGYSRIASSYKTSNTPHENAVLNQPEPKDLSSKRYYPAIELSSYSPSLYNQNEMQQQNSNMKSAGERRTFDIKNLRKLHMQLKHGSKTQIADWIKSAGEWQPFHETCIEELLAECKCTTAQNPTPHASVSTRIPTCIKQVDVSIDTIFLEGVPCLHVVCKGTRWSEASTLPSNSLRDQVTAFKRIQIYRHGAPLRIHGDGQYGKGEFLDLCEEIGAKFVLSAANDHEASGAIESANRMLRSYYRRIRAIDQRSPMSEILAEAVYGKNICKGKKMTCSFELLYSAHPRIMDGYEPNRVSVTVEQQAQHTTRQRLTRMMRVNLLPETKIKIGDHVMYWRDKHRWLGPARVVSIIDGIVTLVDGERMKTSSINRVQRAPIPLNEPIEEDDDDTVCNSSRSISRSPALEKYSDTPEDSPIATRLRSNANPSAPEEEKPETHKDATSSSDSDNEPEGMPGAPWIPRSKESHLSHIPDELINEADIFNSDAYSLTRQVSYVTGIPKKNSTATLSLTAPEKTLTVLNLDESGQLAYVPTAVQPTNKLISPISNAERRISYAKERNAWDVKEAIMVVERRSVNPNSNIIGSHVVYKRKPDGSVKARIVPWGHRDLEKDDLRSDSPCMNPENFRLLLSISVEKNWEIAEMDIAAAYLQATGFIRDIFVVPPREEQVRGVLWKLKKAAYGLADGGRLWYLTSDQALCDEFGLTKSPLESTVYYWKNERENLIFMLVSQVDNYIYCGEQAEMCKFEVMLEGKFHVGERTRRKFTVYGCEISQHRDKSITVTQRAKLAQIRDTVDHAPLTIKMRQPDRFASANELAYYRRVIGQALFIGRMTNPLMLYTASHFATKTPTLMTHHVKSLNASLRHHQKVIPEIHIAQPRHPRIYTLEVHRDASMMHKNGDSARGAFMIFRRCGDIVHPIHWSSRKLRRVARSSSTAEILAAAEGADSALYIASLLKELLYSHNVVLASDSRSFFNLATTLREPEERRNKIDLAAIREAYDKGLIHSIRWIPGHYLACDALTKSNHATGALLLKILRKGLYPHHPDSDERIAPKGEVERITAIGGLHSCTRPMLECEPLGRSDEGDIHRM
eukprot:IDg23568t1